MTLKQVKLAHCPCYVDSLKKPATWASTFGLTDVLPDNDNTRAILTKLLNEYRLKCGGTLLAARLALQHKLAANLAAKSQPGRRLSSRPPVQRRWILHAQ